MDRGPSGSPTAKSGAGFTGKQALRYAGTHKADGRGYSYNKVFDVNVAVRRNTELSTGSSRHGRGRPATTPPRTSSVDLAFTDGTYLSDLKAMDQHGFPLSPQGQGAAKRLYVNQWNNVASRIGQVAAGKTVDRVLVAYDSPKGPAKFRGWVDDVSLKEKAPAKPKAHPSDYALHHPRHQLQRRLLARQHLPRDGRPARLQLLDAGDQRGLPELALRLRARQQRGQSADHPGVQREP